MLPEAYEVPCIPCITSAKIRGRVDCKVGKGRSCTSCVKHKATCTRSDLLWRNHPALRRAYKNFKDYANSKNATPYVKKKGTKVPEYDDDVSRVRSGAGLEADML